MGTSLWTLISNGNSGSDGGGVSSDGGGGVIIIVGSSGSSRTSTILVRIVAAIRSGPDRHPNRLWFARTRRLMDMRSAADSWRHRREGPEPIDDVPYVLVDAIIL